MTPNALSERLTEIESSCSEKGWDSYGAAPVDHQAIISADQFLKGMTVAPTNRGGICIETHTPTFDFSVDFDADGSVLSVLYSRDT